MLGLARSLGFKVSAHPDGGAQVLQVRRELSMQQDALPAAAY
jgi:hypothetical protein